MFGLDELRKLLRRPLFTGFVGTFLSVKPWLADCFLDG
jgi:hypothetical protein